MKESPLEAIGCFAQVLTVLVVIGMAIWFLSLLSHALTPMWPWL
jgi:hypothetical protein